MGPRVSVSVQCDCCSIDVGDICDSTVAEIALGDSD